MTIIQVFLLLIMTMLGAVASLFLKRASALTDFRKMLKNYNIYVGAVLYVLSALLNVVLLRYVEYSTLLPLTSITYMWTIVLAFWVLKEAITDKKIVGVCLIFIGAMFVAR